MSGLLVNPYHCDGIYLYLGGVGAMTEREKDERDLAALKQYEMGVSKRELMRRHGMTKYYLNKLIKEALDA